MLAPDIRVILDGTSCQNVELFPLSYNWMLIPTF